MTQIYTHNFCIYNLLPATFPSAFDRFPSPYVYCGRDRGYPGFPQSFQVNALNRSGSLPSISFTIQHSQSSCHSTLPTSLVDGWIVGYLTTLNNSQMLSGVE